MSKNLSAYTFISSTALMVLIITVPYVGGADRCDDIFDENGLVFIGAEQCDKIESGKDFKVTEELEFVSNSMRLKTTCKWTLNNESCQCSSNGTKNSSTKEWSWKTATEDCTEFVSSSVAICGGSVKRPTCSLEFSDNKFYKLVQAKQRNTLNDTSIKYVV